MAAWILYVLLVSLLLGLAALAFEASAQQRRKGTRWLWGASIIASLAVPFVISSVTVQLPSLSRALPRNGPQAVALRQMTEGVLSPSHWIAAAGQEKFAWSPTTSTVLAGLWGAESILLLGGLLFSGVRLHRRRRAWEKARVAGQPVLVAEDVGPAVVGLFDPEIVVPRWLLNSSPIAQELVIAHEQSHLEANDAQLLLIALALVVCMPWNLPLWWQLRRLRRAIEVDCDARVLRRGHDAGSYGETLLMVGERHAGGIAVVAAMTESKSFLEQRIHTMLRKKAKFAWASALALALVGLVLTAGAAEVTPPNGGRQEITVDAKTLDGYVGKYKFTGTSLATISRTDGQLMAQITGQPAFPIFAESNTDFFFKVVDAQITFVPDSGGVARSLILHQNGANIPMPRIDEAAAQQIVEHGTARFASQTADPAAEAALRHILDGIISGHPYYDRMSPLIAEAFKKQMTYLSKLTQHGPIKSIRFVGVAEDGSDVYSVVQETGATHWRIALDDKGIVVNALVMVGP